MRIQVDLPEKHVKVLNQLSRHRNTSRAAVVRDAIAKYIAECSDDPRDNPLHGVFGLWKDREFDAMQHLDTIRSEWDRSSHKTRGTLTPE